MPFDDNQEDNNNNNSSDKNNNSNSQDDNSGNKANQPNAHNNVFLVAGERAFGDAESVVKKIESADTHIATLEAEGKVNREALDTALAEVSRLKKIEDSLDGRPSGNPDQTDQMSIEEVAAHAAELAVGKIAQNRTVEAQNQNLAGCEAKAKEAYGDTYVNTISTIATKLNMSLKAVDELSKSSPDAFSRLFLPADSGAPHQPTRSSHNAPTGDEHNNDSDKPVNIVKMREGDRMSTVAAKMKAAGVPGY